MNETQQIFSMFYAILFGTMLSNVISFRAFPWGVLGFVGVGFRHERVRLMLAVLMFNVLPFFIFAFGYTLLGHVAEKPDLIWIIYSAFLSLVVFAPYRAWHALQNYNSAWCYTKGEWSEIANERNIKQTMAGNVMATILYMLPLLVLPLLLEQLLCIPLSQSLSLG
ncbi:MAG: hypothetical protein N0E55_17670 [Candidatus Thiodiazotropha taylori]|nr:hypothetical protein [Candidatus Thiodiazotropha taylori]MCG8096107.1 hypothetical protein [Candidatus Thiodiazotropha endolucinida]MCG8106641.1 hypothetical protein [Candidatus Thiodiazotropha taylori]MCG8110861.1 hypothetical protein [Candidatus Thiodiazotropha taylori]MCG8125766.1 hypothetical protein [Candidatus Thiodiazotropha taylori]